MRMRYAVPLVLLAPVLGAGFVFIKAPDARAAITSALVCEVLKTGTASGAITAEGRQTILSEMINSPTLDANVKLSAATASKRC